MKITVEFSDNTSYEINGEQLNPKQIELIANILEIPKMNECIVGQNK